MIAPSFDELAGVVAEPDEDGEVVFKAGVTVDELVDSELEPDDHSALEWINHAKNIKKDEWMTDPNDMEAWLNREEYEEYIEDKYNQDGSDKEEGHDLARDI